MERRLIIYDMQIKDPFTMTMQNNFADLLPFSLYDIFNKTIELASYKSHDDFRLFDSLETVTLKDSGWRG